jgi:hypothetical protein
MSFYAGRISQIAPNEDPRHVEAWLRLGNQPLDRFTSAQFEREVEIAVSAMRRKPRALSEALARDAGL